MTTRYALLSILLCCLIGLRSLGISGPTRFRDEESAGARDHEALLAVGAPLPLRHTTEASLLLIPGIASSTAREILAMKGELLSRAARMETPQRYRALEHVHGIGEKKALKLRKYLSLE